MAPSSSSSEDEDMAKFIEAADSSMYTKYLKKDNEGGCKGPCPPSLRNIEEEQEPTGHKGLNVTPAFQNHVAHHLTQLLDSQLLLDDNSKDSVNTSNDSGDLSVNNITEARKFARARRILAPSKLSHLSEQIPGTGPSPKASQSNSGVRLLGASAVFLSNLDIVPVNARQRPKRGRKIAQFSSGSESSGAESGSSDSDEVEKCSAAAVSADWVLSGAATKGWAHKESKVERCFVDESGILVPVNEKSVNPSYGNASAVRINNNEKEVLSDSAKDDFLAFQSKKKKNKKKKRRALSLDGDSLTLDGDKLAASFNAAVCITSDSPSNTSFISQKKKSQKKRRRKDHNSEDATTETTEVEDLGEDRKKKKKKRKKQKKKADEVQDSEAEVPGLPEEDEDEGIIVKNKVSRKKKKKKSKKYKLARNRGSVKKASRFSISKEGLRMIALYSRSRMAVDGTSDSIP